MSLESPGLQKSQAVNGKLLLGTLELHQMLSHLAPLSLRTLVSALVTVLLLTHAVAT